MSSENREPRAFVSHGTTCAAWYYPGLNGACIVMAGGAGVTKEPATDRFAAAFNARGFSVLAFDYRFQGASEGEPRQVVRARAQLVDWEAALAAAASLPGVDADRIAAWGFSLSGGHVLRLAAAGRVAAAVAQSPLTDGLAIMPNALRHETLSVIMKIPPLALLDVLGGAFGRPPRTIPLAGPRGTIAMLTTPDAQDAGRALDPDHRYVDWRRDVAVRSVLALSGYRPGRAARRITCPLLVVAAREDRSVLFGPAEKVARRAPGAEFVEVTGGHYAAFLDQHDTVLAAELNFLERVFLSTATRRFGVSRSHHPGIWTEEDQAPVTEPGRSP